MDAFGYLVRHRPNRNSLYAITIAAFLHAILILLVFNSTSISKAYYPQPSLQMIELHYEQPVQESIPEVPLINFSPKSLYFPLPKPEFVDHNASSLNDSIITTPYELPDKNAEQYKHIFDPRLRKKLLDAQSFNRSNVSAKSEEWTEIDGRDFIDAGDGLCKVSMQNTDTHSNAKNWGFTTCGKTDSEKSMDRVMADYENHNAHR